MSQIITLNLPDKVFQPVQRTSEAMNQTVEEILLNALQASLPSLDGLPPDMVANLMALETLDDEVLRQVMAESVSPDAQRQIHALLVKKQENSITREAEAKLAECQHQADLVMLRKAHAAALLRFRGRRVRSI